MTKLNAPSADSINPRLKLHFLKYQGVWALVLLIAWLGLHLLINATTSIMELRRAGSSIAIWEPFCWEATSIIMVLILVWPIAKLLKHWPQHFAWYWQLSIHCIAALIFSIVHVSAMVALRELWYLAMASDYQFGDWFFGFIYELRKDVLAYISIVVLVTAYRFIVRRLQGEASLLAADENTTETLSDKLLVKKLGKEFLIAINTIDWVEAAGNYANLHVGNRLFPMRITMAQLSQQLPAHKFSRIHRSIIVNLDRVAHLQALDVGDYEVVLTDDTRLVMSRRYREAFKAKLY